MSSSAESAAPLPAPPSEIGVPTTVPWLALGAVFLGTFISTVNTRFSTFGLADIRGAIHAGFDDGAWITTAQGAAQVLIAPLAVWLGTVFGPRRVLLEAAIAFAVISLIEPFSINLPMLLGLHFAGGLASGFFVPLNVAFVLRNMPPRLWAYGIAIYALNLELSLNISASLEGWYVDHWSWRWIFWQNVPLALGMAACLQFTTHRDTVLAGPHRADWFGFAFAGIGLALIYAALDQGNRLDWQNSPLIWGLALSGALLFAAFLVHERNTDAPFLNLAVALGSPMPRLLLLVGFLRFTLLSTAYVIPQFLGVVRGFRALEVGQTLIWIASPQLFICLLAGYLLRRSDPRIVASVGFLLICTACLMVAYGLTPLWGTDQFLPSALLQALGQSFALSGTIFFAVLHLRPQDALTFGASIQVARIMGGEIGSAFINTFVRVREQIASNQLGQHLKVGDGQLLARIQGYATATASAGDPQSGAIRGAATLARVVQQLATTQAIIDSLIVLAAATAITLILIVTRRAAPLGPASHVPFFAVVPRPARST
ncbi:MAG TPA: MFS transporter [Burkholderiaceae bacterium]|nr:MFS transporter [Burkholderiaceae bacterium]